MDGPRARLSAAALVAVVVCAACITKSIQVRGDAMAPTYSSGQVLFVDTGAYASSSPRRSDVILFKNPAGVGFVVRIVGLPGERIDFSGGAVLVDGKPIAEPYLAHDTVTSAPQSSYLVPAKSYFVMNDNRAFIHDSRTYGPVPRSWIEGRIV